MSCHDEDEPSSSILWKKTAGSDLVKYHALLYLRPISRLLLSRTDSINGMPGINSSLIISTPQPLNEYVGDLLRLAVVERGGVSNRLLFCVAYNVNELQI